MLKKRSIAAAYSRTWPISMTFEVTDKIVRKITSLNTTLIQNGV